MGIIKKIFGKKTPPPSSTTDGKVYGSDFIGPTRPQDTVVNVPDATINRETQQSVVPASTPPKPNHSGGGSSTILTPTTAATVNKSTSNSSQLSDVKVNTNRSVTTGGHTYTGNAVIKNLGVTANQYYNQMREKLKQQMVSQGASNKKIKQQLRPGAYSVKTQTGTEELPSGDKIIYNRFGEPVGVQSKFFGQTMSLDNYEKKVDEYKKQIEGKKIVKSEENFGRKPYAIFNKKEYSLGGNTEYYSDGTYKSTDKKGRTFYGEYDLKTGKELYSGTINPITAEDVSTIAMGGAGLAKLGVKKGLTFAFSGLITKPVNTLYEKYTPQPQTNVGKFVKASITGLAITRSPMLGEAYLADITKALITQPRALAKSAWENKAETLGFAVGGGLLGKGFNLLELQYRGIKVEKVNLPGYGEVIVQKIPKYPDVIWVKGAFSQSEKINIMEQIKRLEGDKARVFVQVSPKGVKTSVFSNRRNLGFEVGEVSNPMRGLYQAPPMKFLEKYKDVINSNAGALSYYASSSRRSILPNPLDLLRSKVRDTFSNQRPAEYIERTYKEVNTPDWIKETSQSLAEGKGIPKQYQAIFNKLYKRFLDTPTKFNGKDYVGLEKEKLVNNLNLRGKGNGVKLKVYAALLEYQNKMKVKLVSGAENLSQILPYGGEHQIVRALGTRFFEKSIKDLRKGVKPSVGRKLVELITGTKRGQKVAMIDGQMVEIYPVRSFERKPTKKKKVKSKKLIPEINLVDRIIPASVIKEYNTNIKIMEKRINKNIKKSNKIKNKPLQELSYSQKEILRQQAKQELNLLEISMGKLKGNYREVWLNKRYSSLERDYLRNRTNKQSPQKYDKFKPQDVSDKLVESIIGERRRERPTTSVPRPFLFRTNVGRNVRTNERVNRPVNRITDLLIPRREPTRIENRPRVNIRNVPRRQEPRRPERPRLDISRYIMDRNPRRPRRPEPRRPETPKEHPRALMNQQKKGKQRTGKEIKKQPDYLTMPTAFEMLSGGVKKGERAKSRISGFESMRFQ